MPNYNIPTEYDAAKRDVIADMMKDLPQLGLGSEEKDRQELIKKYILAKRNAEAQQLTQASPMSAPSEIPALTPAVIPDKQNENSIHNKTQISSPIVNKNSDNQSNIGDVLAYIAAGLGDALSAYGGKQTNFKKDITDMPSDAEKKKRDVIKNYLEQQKTQAEIEKLKLYPTEQAAKLKMAQAALDMRKGSLDARENSLESLNQERDQRRKDAYARLQSDVVSKFNADPSIKKVQQSLDAAKTIRDLATSDNPIAAAAIPTYSARMSGEVGNLSEADKEPFGGSRAILSRMEAAFQQAATGKLTEDNKKFILDLTNLIESRAKQNMQATAKLRAKQYSQVPNYGTEQELYNIMAPELLGGDTGTSQPQSIPQIGQSFNGGKVLNVKRIK